MRLQHQLAPTGRSLVWRLLGVIALLMVTAPTCGYQPPFSPVKLEISADGRIDVVAGKDIVTPVGKFSAEAKIDQTFTSQETAVYIYHKEGSKSVTSVYKIATGQALYVDINGRAGLRVTDRLVELTVFPGTKTVVEIKGDEGGSEYRQTADGYTYQGYSSSDQVHDQARPSHCIRTFGSGRNVQAWFTQSCDEVGAMFVVARLPDTSDSSRCWKTEATDSIYWDDLVLCTRLVDEASIAKKGHCVELYFDGDKYSHLLLTTCKGRTWQVLGRFDGTVNERRCDAVAGSEKTLTYPAQKIVLCVGIYEA